MQTNVYVIEKYIAKEIRTRLYLKIILTVFKLLQVEL